MESKVEKRYMLTLTEPELIAVHYAISQADLPKRAKMTKEDRTILSYLDDDIGDILET